jgi:pimeloyl-ACP methyl ester carboxylesterase
MRAAAVADGSASIRYLEIPGGGPPLVWLHGLVCSSTGELLPAAVQPQLAGRHSVLVDFLGYGYSDKPDAFGYSLEDHAETVGALIDALQVDRCILIGHSFGGSVATLVAGARPNLVAALVLAEPGIDPGGVIAPGIAQQSEDAFAEHGFAELLAGMRKSAAENPKAPPAAHIGITQLISPRGLHRASVSVMRGTEPPIRRVLAGLSIPRFYLGGANSDQALPPQQDLVDAGVGWLTVPDTAHAMGLINPAGFAATVAEALQHGGL